MTCQNPKWIFLPKSIKLKLTDEELKGKNYELYDKHIDHNAEHEVNQKILRKPIWHYNPNYYAVQIPCGECPGCLMDHARDVAVKCACEMETHEEGCFITLTYNNGYCTIKGHENELNLPLTKKGEEYYQRRIREGVEHYQIMREIAKIQAKTEDVMTLKKKDVQDFWKRLRKELSKEDIKIRYVICGEKGDKKKRVHYHALIFGWKPKDLELHKMEHYNGREYPLYKSKTLERIWGHGFTTIGELNFKTASYTARYVQKKFGIAKRKIKRERQFKLKYEMAEVVNILNEMRTYYNKRIVTNEDYIDYFIQINNINKILKDEDKPQDEYINYSNRPGIGYKYFIENLDKIKRNNGIVLNIDHHVTVMTVPKYFKKKWKEINQEEFELWNYQQILKAQKSLNDKINLLIYSKDTPDWKKEIIYQKKQKDLFNSNIKKLVRINADQ